EAGRIMNRHLRQRLAIQLNSRPMQAMDELAVAKAALTNGGIDPDDPQSTEIALADATVSEGIDPRANQRFLDATQQSAATARIALRPLKQAILRSIASGTLGCPHRLVLVVNCTVRSSRHPGTLLPTC